MPSKPDNPVEQPRKGPKEAVKKHAPEVTPQGKTNQEKREARLAEALRENLRRRKAGNKKDN